MFDIRRTKTIYKITLLNTLIRSVFQGKHWPWWSKIDDDVILGAIPLRNLGHMKKILNLGISAVLSLVEPFELTTQGFFANPVQPEEWPAEINYKMISILDYHAPSQKEIEEAVTFIKANRIRGPVYVHCKVGRGRSVVVALCYLLNKNRKLTPETAFAQIKAVRPQICPNATQLKAVETYYEKLQITKKVARI